MPSSFASRHRRHLLDRNPDSIADLYHDAGEMLSFEFGAKQGRDAIRDQYAAFFDFHGEVNSVELDREVEHGDSLFTELTMQSERGTFQLINAFVLDGDRAQRHFTNVVTGEVKAYESGG